jgi:hypothetical protein
VVAYRAGEVRHQSFATRGFQMRNHGPPVEARVVGDPQRGGPRPPAAGRDHGRRRDLREVAVIAQERIVARSTTNGPTGCCSIPRLLGAGPHHLQAVSVYRDRMAVRSAPMDLQVRALNQAPSWSPSPGTRAPTGRGVLGVEAGDAENDVTLASWGERLDAAGDAARARFQVAGGRARRAGGATLGMRTAADLALALCRVAGLA